MFLAFFENEANFCAASAFVRALVCTLMVNSMQGFFESNIEIFITSVILHGLKDNENSQVLRRVVVEIFRASSEVLLSENSRSQAHLILGVNCQRPSLNHKIDGTFSNQPPYHSCHVEKSRNLVALLISTGRLKQNFLLTVC